MRILYAGDTPTINTGFGLVAENLLNRFVKEGHEITALGVNHYGEPYDQKKYPYMIHPCREGGRNEIFGFSKFWWLYQEVKPDIVFFLNDPWLIQGYMEAKPEQFPYPHTKFVAYYPTDGGPLKPEWLEVLNKFDAQVCYSNYAERVVTQSNGNVRPENLHQIYHGVNRKDFYPINQSAARSYLGLPVDPFIVGMVARNQFRKRFDLMVAGFADFAKDKTDAKLYLHCVLNDIGFDIMDLARQFNIEDKLILTEGMTPAHGVSNDRLNHIYNALDVHALISLGDGFGLPVAESMATGCPQLVSGHSCLQELVEGHGGLTVKTAAWIMNQNNINTWGGVSDVKDITEKLETLYQDRFLRIKLAEQAYNYITQEHFTWDAAADRFLRIFKDVHHVL